MTHLSGELEVQEFAKSAAKCFTRDEKISAFTEDKVEAGCFFAVRWGLGNDCVVVFKLDEDFEPINFQQIVRGMQRGQE